jgi:hypothetical protein
MGRTMRTNGGKFLDPEQMTPAERLDALAEVLAQGVLHLGESGELAALLQEPSPGSEPPATAPTSPNPLTKSALRR